MSLPDGILAYLTDNARKQGVAMPAPDADLFAAGVLDSFALVDFVALLEVQAGIRIPDGDVQAENFTTIEAIERYVAQHRGDGG